MGRWSVTAIVLGSLMLSGAGNVEPDPSPPSTLSQATIEGLNNVNNANHAANENSLLAFNLPVRDPQHPNHQEGVPENFQDVAGLREFLKVEEEGRLEIPLDQWEEGAMNSLNIELSARMSKLQFFSRGYRKLLARVVSVVLVRVFRQEGPSGVYLVRAEGPFAPDNATEASKARGEKASPGWWRASKWPLVSGPSMVGENLERSAIEAIRTSLGGLVMGTGVDVPLSNVELVNVLTSQLVLT